MSAWQYEQTVLMHRDMTEQDQICSQTTDSCTHLKGANIVKIKPHLIIVYIVLVLFLTLLSAAPCAAAMAWAG